VSDTRTITEDATGQAGAASSGSQRGLEVGDHLGRFTLRRVIGTGGMGTVFAAYDPTLGREVAVKVMTRADARTRIRFLREAQALARLSHRNVVTIFEVGARDHAVFLAMELIEGETLAAWLARPRTWRAIRDVLVAAGRGLEAAHAAGLVHRDFKPHNVMVCAGRVVVLDFGLARAAEPEPEPDGEPAEAGGLLASSVTESGGRLGTPRYMAPEQHLGVAATASSDQFAFCVTFHEALTGARLFPGATSSEVLAAMRRPVAPAAGVPRFLAAALQRGLSFDPARRFPALAALLRAVSRDPARQARRWSVAGAAAIALTAAGFVVGGAGRAPAACGPGRAPLAGVWDPEQRAAVLAHAAAIDAASGRVRAGAASATLDGYAGAWLDMELASCRATRVAATQSDTLFDLRARCLARRRDELRGTARLLAEAGDAAALDRASTAAQRLTPIADCADTLALTAATPPPRDPVVRARLAALDGQLLAIDLVRRGGDPRGLEARALAALAAARALDHPPALVAALTVLADVRSGIGDHAGIQPVLEELIQAAAAAHDDAATAHALSSLVVSTALAGRPEQAVVLFAAMRAAVLRGGSRPVARVEQLLAEGKAITSGELHRFGDALAALAEARRILVAEGAARPGAALRARLADVELEGAIVRTMNGDVAGGIAGFREVIALERSVYGADHPDEAFAEDNLGEAMRAAGDPQGALEAYGEAVRIRTARVGEGRYLAGALLGFGQALQELGRYRESLGPLTRACQMMRDHVPATDPDRAYPAIALGITQKHLGLIDDARRSYAEAIALERRFGNTFNLGVALLNRGTLAAEAGHCERALPDFRETLAVFEAALGATAAHLIFPLTEAGRCTALLGRPGEALALLERALALSTPGQERAELASARFWHGRVLVETGRDRARGLAEARAARTELAGAGAAAADALHEADAWLARVAR